MGIDILVGGMNEEHARAIRTMTRHISADLRAANIVRIAVLPGEALNQWGVGVLRRKQRWMVTWLDSSIDELEAQVAAALRQLSGPQWV